MAQLVEKHTLEGGTLSVAAALVDVEGEARGRAVFVVVVAVDERDCEAAEIAITGVCPSSMRHVRTP